MPHSYLLSAAGAGRFVRWVRLRVGFPLLDVVLPTDCFACDTPLGPMQRGGACMTCWSSLRPLRSPLCPTCGLSRPDGTDLLGPAQGRCAACLLRPTALSRARSAVAYDTTARAFLLRAKSGGRRELLLPFGQQLGLIVERYGLARDCDVIVPVPADPWTELYRGFNPPGELARVVGRRCGITLAPRLLRRRLFSGLTPSKRLRAAQRLALARTAFTLRGDPRGLRVLLIDDVMTTGATLEACAGLLSRGGAIEIRAATWARTLPGPV